MLNSQKPLATKFCMKKQKSVIGRTKLKNHEDWNGSERYPGPQRKNLQNLHCGMGCLLIFPGREENQNHLGIKAKK